MQVALSQIKIFCDTRASLPFSAQKIIQMRVFCIYKKEPKSL